MLNGKKHLALYNIMCFEKKVQRDKTLGNTINTTKKEFTTAQAAIQYYSPQKINTTLIVAGPLLILT